MKYRNNEKLNALEAWGKKNGCIVSDKVKIVAGELGSVLIAQAEIVEEEEVITCSEKVMFSPRVAKSLFGTSYDEQFAQIFNKLALVREFLNGDSSEWAPYIGALPQPGELDLPVFYNQEQLKSVEGTNLMNDIEVRLKDWTSEYDTAMAVLPGDKKDQFTLDLYLWACGIFASRSFPARLVYPEAQDDISILVPLVDSLNHKLEAPVHWTCTHNSKFTLRPAGAIMAGDEISNNYGPKSNEEFLFSYGFCLEDNPYDTASLKLPASIPQELIQQTREAGHAIREDLLFFITQNDPVPESLQMLLRLFVAHNNNNGHYNTPVATIQSIETLKTGIQNRLNNIRTNNSETSPKKYVAIYRSGQERLYNLALDKCNQIINSTLANSTIYDLESLSADGKNSKLIQSVCEAFTGRECDDRHIGTKMLLDMGVEDVMIILHLCLNPELMKHRNNNSANMLASYQGMYDDMIAPLVQMDSKLFSPQLLTLQNVTAAGTFLQSMGYEYSDSQGRDRFRVIV